MKRNVRVYMVLAIALCAMMLFTACASSGPVAVEVGDRKVTVQQLENTYLNSESYASYYGYDTSTEEGKASYVTYLLNSLVQDALLAYEAEQAGITLTAEEEQEAKTAADKAYTDFYQQYVDYAKQAGATDVTAYANKYFADALAENGKTVTQVKKDYLAAQRESLMVAKHKAQLLEGVTPTDEELKTMYDEELASQKELFDATPGSYFTYESYYNYGYCYMPLYVPAGFFRVRQILVADEATAQAVLEKINAGEDFETLLAAYNTDPGMANEAYADGYLVGEGANFVEAFLTAALALENDGDVSEAVQSTNGYHIIKRVSTEASREIPYEEVAEAFNTMAVNNYQTEHYNKLIEEWKNSGVVTYYEENYASVGK